VRGITDIKYKESIPT